jgi:MFS family permease
VSVSSYAAPVRLGLRANAGQFSLLIGVNVLVGAMVGVERSVLPLVGEQEFGLASRSAILSFIVAFGVAKAGANLAAGALADRAGRRRLLVAGWALALPVPLLVALAPTWELIVVANLFLGASQGLAWSMTVLMKIDLAGPRRRGLALGLNESAGYLGVAATALATGALAATFTPRTVVWVGALAVAALGTVLSAALVRDTAAHVAAEQLPGERGPRSLRSALVHATVREPVLRACAQAGLVNNLNDALAWGLVPLYLAAHGASIGQIGAVAAVYPAVWGAGQLPAGWLSDRVGRKLPIVAGMACQAGALALLVQGEGAFAAALAAAALLGVGTALAYPTLIAAVSDVVSPRERASAIGVYRFWRDTGFVAGAVLAGVVADSLGSGRAIAVVAALTAGSGVWVAATRWTAGPGRRAKTIDALLREARAAIRRVEPGEAFAALGRGAILVDIREVADRERDGVIPGSVHVPRNVLEWRADPASPYRNPEIADVDAELYVLCGEGYSSSLAAAALRELGFTRAGDVVGGFAAWNAAGLPVRPARAREQVGLPGMGPPEPSVATGSDTRGRRA